MPQAQSKPSNANWSSRFAFIMATTGAAVGLGNIWMFPYVAGKNGGAAFVGLYLLLVLCLGIPAMMAEIALGCLAQKNSVNALIYLSQKYRTSSRWAFLGWWGALGLLIVLAFYCVIAGWTVAYAIKSLSGVFNTLGTESVLRVWSNFLSSPWEMLLWHTFFMGITLWIVARGLLKGIEQASKILMPALFLILLVLMGYACSVGEFKQAWHFLFHFDLSKVTTQVLIEALGLAFFTLALGAGCLLVYGAYLPPKTRIASSVSIIAFLDVLVALCAAMAIFPIVFQYGLAPEGGPGLVFKVLPIAFAQMPAGQFIGTLFFILLWFAAWTSTISLAEPLVLLLVERTKFKRVEAAWVVGVVAWLLGMGALLSFNQWRDLQPFGHTIFEWMVIFVNQWILPVGVIGFSLFAGWYVAKRDLSTLLEPLSTPWFNIWRFAIRFAVPLAILWILGSTLYAMYESPEPIQIIEEVGGQIVEK